MHWAKFAKRTADNLITGVIHKSTERRNSLSAFLMMISRGGSHQQICGDRTLPYDKFGTEKDSLT